MDINKISEKFLNMEKKYKLFNFINEDGIYYWDIVRYNVYNIIVNSLSNNKIVKKRKKKHYTIGKLFKLFYNIIINELYLFYIIHFKNIKYVFYISSRYRNKDGDKFVDFAVEDVLNFIDNNYFIIESFNNKSKAYFPYYLIIKKKLFKLTRLLKIKNKNYKVAKIIKDNFSVNKDINQLIDEMITNFKIDYYFYKRIFTKINPKIVFVNQNGIQKGLFAAANDLNITTVEIQHGLINYNHMAYSYNKSISYNHINTLPKYYLTMSDFWKNNVYYPVKMRTIGNSNFYCKPDKSSNKYAITIIFANIYTKNLLKLTKEIATHFKNEKIFVKLHPNQRSEINFIREKLKHFCNIKVIFDEKNVKHLFKISHSIVVIQSTTVYEALQSGVKVFIYKKQNYTIHKDIFNNENVYLVDSINDIKNNIHNKFIFNKNIQYFNSFDRISFKNLLKEINYEKKHIN